MNILKMIHEAALASEASTVKIGKNVHLLHFARDYALVYFDICCPENDILDSRKPEKKRLIDFHGEKSFRDNKYQNNNNST